MFWYRFDISFDSQLTFIDKDLKWKFFDVKTLETSSKRFQIINREQKRSSKKVEEQRTSLKYEIKKVFIYKLTYKLKISAFKGSYPSSGWFTTSGAKKGAVPQVSFTNFFPFLPSSFEVSTENPKSQTLTSLFEPIRKFPGWISLQKINQIQGSKLEKSLTYERSCESAGWKYIGHIQKTDSLKHLSGYFCYQ